MITYNIKINPLKGRTSHSDIVLTTGDVQGYKFVFTFGNADFENATLTLKARRADGEVVTAVSDFPEIVLPNNMYAVAGEIVFEIAVSSSGGEYVTVHVLTALVREGFGDDGIEGDDRYPVLTYLINEMNGYKTTLKKIIDETGSINGETIAKKSILEDALDDNLARKINTQSNWSQSDTKADDYIKNKPNLTLKEDKSNKVAEITGTQTGEMYPNVEAVVSYIDDVVDSLSGSLPSNLLDGITWKMGYISALNTGGTAIVDNQRECMVGESYTADVIPVTEGKTYVLTYHFKPNDNNSTAWWAIRTIDNNGATTRIVLPLTDYTVDGITYIYTYEYVAGEGVTAIQISGRTNAWYGDKFGSDELAKSAAPGVFSMLLKKEPSPMRLLPIVTDNDNGKHITVKDGKWTISDDIYQKFSELTEDMNSTSDDIYQKFSELTEDMNSTKEDKSNKVTEITGTQTGEMYPNVEAVVSYVDDVVESLNGSWPSNLLDGITWKMGYISALNTGGTAIVDNQRECMVGESYTADVIPVTEGETYVLTYHFKPNDNNSTAWWAIRTIDNNGATTRIVLPLTDYTVDGITYIYTYEYVAGEGVTAIQISGRTNAWYGDKFGSDELAKSAAPGVFSMLLKKEPSPMRLLPIVTDDDNGKHITVKDGKWTISDDIYQKFSELTEDMNSTSDDIYQKFSELTEDMNSTKEDKSNKVTEITGTQTGEMYPNVEAVVSYVDDVIDSLNGSEVGNLYTNNNIRAVNHRGYCTVAPENTLAAYRLSKKMGFEYAECDISFTSDGVAVLLHDSTVDRTSDGTGKIGELTLEDVKAMDFGSWMSSDYAGEQIPTFEEFIILCKQIGIHPYIEIKGGLTNEQATSLVGIVKRYGMHGKVTWISFYPTALTAIKTVDSTARLGFVTENTSEDNITTANNLKTGDNEVFIDISYYALTDDFLNLCVENDIPLEAWTINDKTTLITLDPYVSGYTSDSLRANVVLYNALT